MEYALAFRERVMPPGGDWDLATTFHEMIISGRYHPTTTWSLGAGLRYEAAQALFEVSLNRLGATKVQTNRIFFNIEGRPTVWLHAPDEEEAQPDDNE